MKHEFFASRNRAQGISEKPFWEDIYRKAFPGFNGHIIQPSGEHHGQYAGVDRVVTLESGTVLFIDEKIRYQPYEDILLEFWAVKEKQVPGWVALDLAADFICYAVLPLNKCYMLPVPLLRRAWHQHGEDWKRRHQIVVAKNNTYTSESVAVPCRELLAAIANAMLVHFEYDATETNEMKRAC